MMDFMNEFESDIAEVLGAQDPEVRLVEVIHKWEYVGYSLKEILLWLESDLIKGKLGPRQQAILENAIKWYNQNHPHVESRWDY